MTDSSEKTSDHIDYVQRGGDRDCNHTKTFYRVGVQTAVDHGHQIDTETQATTGVASKDKTGIGVEGEIGMSGPLPKGAVKGKGQKQWATEVTGSKSNIDRTTAFVTESMSVEWELVNPNKVDIADPNIVSGCLDTADNGDYCENHIQRARKRFINDITRNDFENIDDDINKLSDRSGFSELETPKTQETSTIGRYASKVRDSFENAMGTIQSGLTTTVEKARGRFADDDATLSVSPDDGTELGVTHRDDGTTVTLADGSTERADTTVAVGASGEFQPSYTDDGAFTVDIAEETDATIAVSPGDDDADWSVTDDGVEMGLADGAVTVDQGADDLQMETDEDGTITLTMGDGHTPERSNTNADENNAKTNDGTAEATEATTTTAAESAQSVSNGTPNHTNGADGTDPSQTQNSDGDTPFLGYDDGREQARHSNGHDSTGTTNSEEASNDADNDEEKDPGGTSL